MFYASKIGMTFGLRCGDQRFAKPKFLKLPVTLTVLLLMGPWGETMGMTLNWDPLRKTCLVSGPDWMLTAHGARRLGHGTYILGREDKFVKMVITDKITLPYPQNEVTFVTEFSHTREHPNRIHDYELTPASTPGDRLHSWTYSLDLTYLDKNGVERKVTKSWVFNFVVTVSEGGTFCAHAVSAGETKT